MTTPQITITPAGFAAIVNAENTGTAPVKITHVGLTAQHFDVATVGAAVPNEAKRLTTFGGKAIADDTLHLNVRDDSQDTYTLRGFGLYLEGGTLFAVYSQATPIMEKAAAATLLLATDIRFTNITAASIEVGDVDFINPPASTTQLGVVRLATEQEADGGADHTTAITPRGLAGYINRRFGAGAPSDFVKGLLGAATAAIFRVQLGLKSAAIRDEGHGNGLNADLLDGEHGSYYLDWRNFSNIPNSFNPGKHSHPISDVDGLKQALDGKQPSGSYASAAHNHSISNVDGLAAELNGRVRLVTDGDWITLAGNWLTTNKIRNADASTLRWTAPADYTMVVSFPAVDSEVGLAIAASFNSENRFWVRSRHDARAATGWERWKPWAELAVQNENATFKNLTVTGTINKITGSSRKLKNIDGPLVGALDVVRAIEVVVGRYKDDYGDDYSDRAFVIAEQLQEVFPSAVKDGLIEYRGEKVLGVDYEMLITPLIGAVKQLADTVDRQAGMIEALSKRLEKLEGKV